MKVNKKEFEVEYEAQLKKGHREFWVDVREDHILPCGEIESEYVEGFEFATRKEAEAKWNKLGKKYEDKMRRENGGLIDYQNWIDETSKIVEILINDGEFVVNYKKNKWQ